MLPRTIGQLLGWGMVFGKITIKHNTGDAQVESEKGCTYYIHSGTHSRSRGSWTPDDIYALDWNIRVA